ncbi:MAG: Asp-tRNA(Asn)/Glu-tRNA(Gln) amidotransferase subunit GatC [Bacilli bacterium]|nr:Asp-tRNA(Asn)/Glu-tRNA(Gln) amidotransferase subunit GatC [Bacilli bacterium]MDD4053363.1 Asp-tRNA(Asn)/Glu-tRNA(Gln) amidotransferase subunit GatC [Bacilli bacterium]MDD4410990.1 Asp-tRNA(Asn)/Glu-tRNA(Gln) amidotransferase subunit GatC [Bacilli bacterium]
MESLSKGKVLHVADLGKIAVSDEEVEKFGYGLKQILDEIDKINELDIKTEEILISPTNNVNVYRDDKILDMLPINDVIKNAPKNLGNYIEVVRVVND